MRAYLRIVILGILVFVAAASSYRFFRVSYYHLKAPHDIGFETHNLATIKSIKAGANIYDRSFYSDLPFIMTIYNPLFHYMAASLPESSFNPFFVGRLISLISTVLIGMLLFLPGGGKRNSTVAFFFVVSFFLLRWVVMYAAYLRSDTLGMLFSAAAIVLLDRVHPKNPFLVLIAFLCFLAFLSKQSFVAASITCCLFLIVKNRKTGIFFTIVLGSMYAIFAAMAQSCWGSGYWFSAYISLLKTPASLYRTLSVAEGMLGEPLLVFLTIITAVTVSYAIYKGKSSVIQESPYPIYLFFSFVTCVASAAKLGSTENSFLEVMLALLLWNVYFSKGRGQVFTKNLVGKGIMILFLLLAGLELMFAKPDLYSLADAGTIALREKTYRVAKEEIAGLKPVDDRFVSLNTPAAAYKVQSGAYLNDPFNYWMMWDNKILDVRPFVRSIQEKRFSLILIVDAANSYGTPSMPTFPAGPAFDLISQAVSENYILAKKGVFIYLEPRKESVNPKDRPR
jgi:hypothetical protein